MRFPDHSNGENIIETYGKAEILYKHGKKIMRFNKHTIGYDYDIEKYELIKDLFKGDVLNIGLGMGTSVNTILNNPNVNSLIVYEIEEDIIGLYNKLHTNEKLTIHNLNAFTNIPSGKFDCILYELFIYNEEIYNKSINYINLMKTHLKKDGIIVLEYNEYFLEIAKNYTYDIITNGKTGLGRRNQWIVINN